MLVVKAVCACATVPSKVMNDPPLVEARRGRVLLVGEQLV